MANFNVDTNGNLWIGTNVSDTFSTAQGQSATNFYVTSAGSIFAKDGTIGGIDINTSDIQANYSSGTSGFKIDTNGDAEFNSVDIRIEQANSDTPSTGFTTLDIGSTQIYENNDDLYINTSGTNNFVKIRDRLILTPTSTSASNMQLMFDGPGSGDAMGFWHDTDWPNSDNAELYWTNQSGSGDYNKIAYVTTQDDYFHLGSDAPGIKTDFTGSPTFYFDGPGSPGTDSATFNMAVRPYAIKDKDGQVGSSGQVLSSTGSRIDWIDLPSGNDHPDSDHDFASSSSVSTLSTSLTNHANSSSAHGTFDNYGSWNLNVNGSTSISSGETVTFTAGTNMGISRSGNTVSYSSPHSLSMANTTGNNSAYPFVTAVSSHTITRTRTSSATISAAGYSVNSSGGYVGAPGVGVTLWYSSLNSTSDETLKTGITDLTYGLDWINNLRPISYRYDTYTVYVCENDLSQIQYLNSDDICEHCQTQNTINTEEYNHQLEKFNNGEIEEEPVEPTLLSTGLNSQIAYWGNEKENWGFSAQEIEATLPTDPDLEIVEDTEFIDGNTKKVLDYNQMIAPLVKAVQELSAKNDELESRLAALEG